MKLQAESTTKTVSLFVNGVAVPARIWEAVTERGVRCHLYVIRVAVARDQDATQFEEELLEQKVPSAEIQAIPLRLIL